MTAAEARKMSHSLDIAPRMQLIYSLITKAAKDGHRSIETSTNSLMPTPHQSPVARAICDRLKAEGYTVTRNFGDQREPGDSTKIAW
jgi:hypothetical protein